jgi:NADH-quinone oxidoreductase subunit H
LSLVETLLRAFFAWLIYPGFLFLAIAGILIEGLRRQFAGRVEGREGPGWLQGFFELAKLLRKPTPVPAGYEPPEDDQVGNQLAGTRREGSRWGLFAIPVFGILALATGAALLPLPGNVWPFLNEANKALGADLLGAGLLFLVPALGAILLGSLGGSVYSQLAGARVFQLLVACAVPYTVAVFGPALALGKLDLTAVASADSLAMLGVKALCGLLFLLCLPVILRLKPLAASSGEVLEGLTNDLGGPPLALFKLMQWMERLALSLFFAVLFVPFAHANPFFFIAGVLLALGIIGIVDALFSQVRLRDAFNFYLRYTTPAALGWLVLLALAIKV